MVMLHLSRSRLALLALLFLFACQGGKGPSPADAGADGDATIPADGHSDGDLNLQGPLLDAAQDAPQVSAQDAPQGAMDAQDTVNTMDAAGIDGQGDPIPLDGGLDSGRLGDDIVFDGLDSDGVRRILLWPAGSSTAIKLGAGYAGSNPSPRRDGRAVLMQSLATATELSGLMIADDFTRPARFFAERSSGAEREPAWSPDGRHVAFVAHEADPAGDVWVAEVDGDHLKDIRNLTPCSVCGPIPEPETTPTWSPDGTRIAFTSYAGASPAIWVMNADGSAVHPLTVTDGQSADYFPSWSPDGRFIAFQRNGPGPARIGIVALENGATRFLDLPGSNYSPSWSRDGRLIALATKRSGAAANLAIVTVEGVEVAYLDRPGDDHHPAWLTR